MQLNHTVRCGRVSGIASLKCSSQPQNVEVEWSGDRGRTRSFICHRSLGTPRHHFILVFYTLWQRLQAKMSQPRDRNKIKMFCSPLNQRQEYQIWHFANTTPSLTIKPISCHLIVDTYNVQERHRPQCAVSLVKDSVCSVPLTDVRLPADAAVMLIKKKK